MQGRLTYSEEALGHLDRLTNFLVLNAGLQTDMKVINDLLDRFDTLAKMPYIGREHPDPLLAERGYRVYTAGRYVGVYLVTEEGVWIAGIYHTKTDWLICE